MAGSRGCFKKKLEKKRGGGRKKNRGECIRESKEMRLHSRGHEDRQCSPSWVQLPDSPLPSSSVLPGDCKARSPTAPKNKAEELLLEIQRGRQANVALLGCGEAGLGSSRGRAGRAATEDTAIPSSAVAVRQ